MPGLSFVHLNRAAVTVGKSLRPVHGLECRIPPRLYPMSITLRHRIQLTTLALGATILAAGAPLTVGAATKSPTTTTVLNAAKASMLKAGGVHVVVASQAGTSTSHVVVDIGPTSGMETIMSGKKFVSIIVTPTYAYLKGSPTGLTGIMGFTAAQQKKLGDHSMSIKSSTAPYANLKANLTTPIFASMLPAVTGTKLSTTGSLSNLKYQLVWTTAATSTAPKAKSVMTLSSGKSTLPESQVITSAVGGGSSTFSRWGERVKVFAPSSSSIVTYKSVFG